MLLVSVTAVFTVTPLVFKMMTAVYGMSFSAAVCVSSIVPRCMRSLQKLQVDGRVLCRLTLDSNLSMDADKTSRFINAVVRLIAATLNVSSSCVALLRGGTSRHKDLLVRDMDLDKVREMLATSLADHGCQFSQDVQTRPDSVTSGRVWNPIL